MPASVPFFASESLPLFQHLLESKVAPDVLVRLWDAGIAPSLDDLEKGVPRWLRDVNQGSAWEGVSTSGEEPSLDWDWGGDLEAYPLEAVFNAVDRAQLWREHALLRMVRSGLNPELPLSSQPTNREPPTLLEWAHAKGMPFLVQECLSRVSAERRQALTNPATWGSESAVRDRVSYALSEGMPLLAQAWKNAGASVVAVDAEGRTPLFYCTDERSLRWALDQGLSLDHSDKQGLLPYSAWEERVGVGGLDDDRWVAMQEYLNRLGGEHQPHFPVVMEAACQDISESKVKELWGRHPIHGVLPSGHTGVGTVCLALLQKPFKNEQWISKNANMVLAFLISRVDMEVLFSTRVGAVSDAELLGLCIDRYGENFRLLKQRLPAALKRAGQVELPRPGMAQALEWGPSQGLNAEGQENLFRWASGHARDRSQILAQLEPLSPEDHAEEGTLLQEGLAFASAWGAWVKNRLAIDDGKMGTILWRGSPLYHAMSAAQEHVLVWQENPSPPDAAILAWTDVLFEVAAALLRNGASLEGDEDCALEFSVWGSSQKESTLLASALGGLVRMSEHPALSQSTAFWGRFSRLVATQDHRELNAWVRSHGLEDLLPAPPLTVRAKPRF